MANEIFEIIGFYSALLIFIIIYVIATWYRIKNKNSKILDLIWLVLLILLLIYSIITKSWFVVLGLTFFLVTILWAHLFPNAFNIIEKKYPLIIIIWIIMIIILIILIIYLRLMR